MQTPDLANESYAHRNKNTTVVTTYFSMQSLVLVDSSAFKDFDYKKKNLKEEKRVKRFIESPEKLWIQKIEGLETELNRVIVGNDSMQKQIASNSRCFRRISNNESIDRSSSLKVSPERRLRNKRNFSINK